MVVLVNKYVDFWKVKFALEIADAVEMLSGLNELEKLIVTIIPQDM